MLLNPKQNRYCNSSGYFYTVPGKTMRKVLGKEFEEEPFFKRVFLNMPHKAAILASLLFGGIIFIYSTPADLIELSAGDMFT